VQFDYGVAAAITVSGGAQYVYGTAGGTMLSSGAQQFVYGVAVSTTLQSGAVQHVYGLGSATLLAGGQEIVIGTTFDDVLDGDAVQTVSSGGVVISTTVSATDSQVVLAGGLASATMVSSGGLAIVSSGGTERTIVPAAHAGAVLRGDHRWHDDLAGGIEEMARAIPSVASSQQRRYPEVTSARRRQYHRSVRRFRCPVHGAASGTVVSSGTVIDAASTVSSGQTLTISAGQASSGIVVLTGGTEVVLSGGVAMDNGQQRRHRERLRRRA
jgi:autotransporter passenger strand-loop-strand repeat protein